MSRRKWAFDKFLVFVKGEVGGLPPGDQVFPALPPQPLQNLSMLRVDHSRPEVIAMVDYTTVVGVKLGFNAKDIDFAVRKAGLEAEAWLFLYH